MRNHTIRLIGAASLVTLMAAVLMVVLGFEEAPGRLMAVAALGVVALPLVTFARAAAVPRSRRRQIVARAIFSRRAALAISVYVRLLQDRNAR
jgi:hypothetical protein